MIEDITFVQAQVRGFAQAQLASMSEIEVETLPGVFLGHKHLPVASAGAYIPGGRYPLTASAHMTVLTAKAAGVERVSSPAPRRSAARSPPRRSRRRTWPAPTRSTCSAACRRSTALALGTETIGKVDLIAGPGNAYVAEAKRQLFGEVGIDLFAGPTEILVIADDDRRPGGRRRRPAVARPSTARTRPAILVTTSRALGETVLRYVEAILPGMPTRDFAGPAWRDHGQVIVDRRHRRGVRAWPTPSPSEHVEVLTADPRDALAKMRNYGALFLGEGTCVSYGDKVIGTNHVLPTRGAARYTGGLWVGKYLKTVTYQEVRDPASSALLGEVCGRASRVELFEGHARSGDIRAGKVRGTRPGWLADALQPVRRRVTVLTACRPVTGELAGRTALVTGAGNGLGPGHRARPGRRGRPGDPGRPDRARRCGETAEPAPAGPGPDAGRDLRRQPRPSRSTRCASRWRARTSTCW